nr:hypothetical protein [Pseudosporangium ferrugineum]
MTSTALAPGPGSSRRTYAALRALSRMTRTRRSLSTLRYSAAASSASAGIARPLDAPRAQQPGQGVRDADRPLVGAAQVEVDLPVGEFRPHRPGGLQRQAGLADPGHPGDHAHHHGRRARSVGRVAQRPFDPVQFLLAAGEVERRRGRLPGPGGAGADPLPRRPPAGEDLLPRLGELRAGVDAQLVGEPPAHAVVRLERGGLLPRAGERDHQLGVQRLVPGVPGRERAQPRQHV